MMLRSQIRRWLSPTLFALIGLSFFLPFATVSCDDARTRVTGAQLVTQTVPRGGKLKEEKCSGELSDCVERDSSSKAALMLLAAALGSFLAAFGVRRGPGWCAAVGLVATLTLAGSALGLEAPEVDFHSGYFAALFVFLMLSAGYVVRRIHEFREGGFSDDARGPGAVPVRLLVTAFWTGLCAVLLARYDFHLTSRFAFGLFVALLIVVGIFLLRVIHGEVRFWRRSGSQTSRSEE
jgi:hypothetical protein